MTDALILRGLVMVVALYGLVRAVRGHWSGLILTTGCALLAFAS